MTVSATYHINARTDLGGNYTLSRLWGDFDGENVASGPFTSTDFQYPGVPAGVVVRGRKAT